MPANNGSNIAQLNDSARTVLVGETLDYPSSISYTNLTRLFGGHLGQVNFLYADGHVKSVKPTSTVTPVNMWNVEENMADGDPTMRGYMQAWDAKINQ